MVNRTPPRPRRASPHASSHPSNTGQEQEQDDDDEDMTPARPAAPIPEEPTLRSVMDAVLAMRTELRDNQRQVQECQRQIQDLNALFIRTNSPLGRDNRAPSPTMRRSPQPEHQQQRERGPHPARMPRFDTAPPEDDIYGQLPSHSQACNQTEQTEQTLRSGSARWLACSVRLARWPILAARARFGSAKQPNRLLALG